MATKYHFQIDEDDPAKFKQSVHILTMKLFADLERRRRQQEDKISTDAARKREQELDNEERKSIEKEFAKNWEDSRQGRVNSWLNFKWGKSTPGTSAPAPPPPTPCCDHTKPDQREPEANNNIVESQESSALSSVSPSSPSTLCDSWPDPPTFVRLTKSRP